MGTNRNLICHTGLQKCEIQNKILHHFGGFFHQIKVRLSIGRKDSIQTVIRTSRWLEAAQNFEVFSNIRDEN
jgi:hypothetical protein